MDNGLNVMDELKHLTPAEIRLHCLDNSFPAAVAMSHITGDFNFSCIVRNANFFGLRKAFYLGGRRHWDKRGAVGTYNYTDVEYIEEININDWMATCPYSIVALENNVDFLCEDIYSFDWPRNSLILVGEENSGLSDDMLNRCDHIVSIPGKGSVRSVNAAVAAGIAMSLYNGQFRS